MKRILVPVLALLAIVGVASACGSDDDENSGGSESSFNDADVTFVQGMIPHHEQAIEMAELASSRAESPEVKDLAARIEDAQGPEIAQMRRWLEEWDEPETPKAGDDMGGGMDDGMDDGGGAGMMTAEDMDELRSAQGAEFDKMFLTSMVAHHKGAVEMAKTERKDGENADAKKLAGDIIETQEAEIDEMTGLLDSNE